MDRRKSLKAIIAGSLAAGSVLEACEQAEKKRSVGENPSGTNDLDRMAEEKVHNKKLLQESFFTPDEMATISILADILIPKDEISPSATEVKVPEFIEFIVKDMPEHQVPMRGGLRWLDLQSIKLFDNSFRSLGKNQQLQLIDEIAFPLKVKEAYRQGASFFSLMRNLTISGFYTTQEGVNDLGYMGNRPNQWNGVPPEVLKQYNISYSEKELKECISFENEQK
jgi:gluconate 2-dehydrogenase gamma chain